MPERGEVWQVDFGMTQKVRPALVISIPYADTDRALIGVIPHTTAKRGSQFEVSVPTRCRRDCQPKCALYFLPGGSLATVDRKAGSNGWTGVGASRPAH